VTDSSPAEVPGKQSVMLVVALAAFIGPFMASAVNVALPTIARELAMNAIQLSWVATGYILSGAVFMLPMGRLADIFGRKRIFTYGVIGTIISSLLVGFANSATMLLVLRIFQGVSASMMLATTTAIVSSAFPPGERGRALGITVASVYLGLTLGPSIGGLLTSQLGWRSIFFGNTLAGVIIIVAVLWKFKGDWVPARGAKFDLIGSLIYAPGLVALIYGFTMLPDVIGIAAMAAGVALLALFLVYESRQASPVLDVKLFTRNRVFAFSSLAALINYAATFAVAFLLSLYLQYIKALSPEAAGGVILAMPAVQAVFSPFTGRLSDKVEPRLLASLGMFLCACGLLMLVFIGEDTAIGYVIGSLLLLGFGFAFFSSPNTNAIMGAVTMQEYGVAGAVVATMRTVGQTLSLGIVMLLLGVFIGDAAITPANHAGFISSLNLAFIIFTVLCVGGIFASLARGNSRN
jgi:EmrB/QacA subfamily drug resistance transporter